MTSTDLFSLKGRVALVTGGSRGIGRMIAAGFIAQGAKVYISSRKADACEKRPRSSPRAAACIALPVDVSTVAGAQALAAAYHRARAEAGHPGQQRRRGLAAKTSISFPEKGWDKVLDLNLKTPFFLTQALHGALTGAATPARPAKVINIASIDGISVNPQETYSYAASKAGLIHLTRRMALRLVKDHIVVSASRPARSTPT